MSEVGKKGLGRRKACDLCFKKKIKCDAKQPACSHCILYNKKCAWTADLYEKHLAPKRRVVADRHKQLETRVAELEDQLQQLAAAPLVLTPSEPYPHHSSDLNSADTLCSPQLSVDEPQTIIERTKTMTLPSLQESLPIVEHYFSTCNHFVPIFDERKFKLMLNDWYLTQGNRDNATWAAINVVLALSLQQRLQHDDTSRNKRTMMTRCLNNTRSVITDLVTRKDDLKGIQVLLGLSVFLTGSPEVELVPTLVASAVKLCQWLGLYRKLGADHLDHREAKERERVFWITYVLDRDISLRTRVPCLIQNHDLDMEMPGFEDTADTVGILIGSEGRSWFNFFRCRVHLARIQGLVYDWVFSLPAERLSPSEKYDNMNRIATMLRDWRNAIPEEYKVDRLQTMDSRVAQPLASLYLTECFTLFKARAHTAFSNDPDSMKVLTYCCSRWLSGYGHLSAQHEIQAESVVLPDWQNLVASARVCGKLFRGTHSMNPQAAFLYRNRCAYISATVILIANKVWISRHGLSARMGPDEDFIQKSLQFMGTLGDKTDDDPFRRMHTAASELNSRAGLAARTDALQLATFDAPSLQMNQWYFQGDIPPLKEFEFQAETVEDP